MIRYPFQPAYDICHVRAEDPFVNMDFIENDPFQVWEKVIPSGMIRQNSHMEHIRICEYDPGIIPYDLTLLFRGIPVINTDERCFFRIKGGQAAVLVLCECFCREYENSRCIVVWQKHFDQRYLITETFSAGSSCCKQNIFWIINCLNGFPLMVIQEIDPFFRKQRYSFAVQPCRKGYIYSIFLLIEAVVCDFTEFRKRIVGLHFLTPF